MRIALLLAPAPIGGLEAVVLGLARGIREHGVQVVLLPTLDLPGGTDHPFVRAAGERDLPVHPVAVPARAYLQERRSVEEVLRRERIDLVHTHGYRSDLIGGWSARRTSRPWVSTVHGFTGGGRKNSVYEWVQVQALRRCDRVVAVSDPLGALLERRGVPAERVTVIANGLEVATSAMSREEARRELGLPPDGLVIGWVGRLGREKGPDVLVDALARMRDRAWTVAWMGDGPERATLEQQAKELGMEARCRWYGVVPDARRRYRAFDVLALSSRTEGTPMVVLEAMAAGVPVVATAVGGVPALLHPDRGWLVPPDDPDALAVALRESMENRKEAETRAHAATAWSRASGGEAWVDRYLQLYATLAAPHPGGSEASS